MEFVATAIAGVFAVRHDVRADARGRFKRQYCEADFAAAGLIAHWVQVNHSVTVGRGAIRGLHYQRPPHAEAKLVSCPAGRAFDVAVDLRQGSATFLKWVAVEIDEATSVYLPVGCAHGFQALSDEVHLIYQHSAAYAPEAEGGIRFDDPAVGIAWPLRVGEVSERDRSFPPLDDGFTGLAP